MRILYITNQANPYVNQAFEKLRRSIDLEVVDYSEVSQILEREAYSPFDVFMIDASQDRYKVIGLAQRARDLFTSLIREANPGILVIGLSVQPNTFWDRKAFKIYDYLLQSQDRFRTADRLERIIRQRAAQLTEASNQ